MRWRRLLRGSSGSSAMIALGSGIGQIVVLAVSPVLSRLYSPDQFGVLTVFIAVTSVVGTFAVFRLDAAIPLPGADRMAAAMAWLAVGLSLIVSAIVLGLGQVIGGSVANWIGSPAMATLWWLVAIAAFAKALDQIFLTWMVREKRYRALALRNALQGIGQAGGQVVLGAPAVRSLGLLIGWIVGRIAAIGGLFSSGGLLRQGVPTWRRVRCVATRYRRFPLVASWSALLNVLGQQAPFLVISAFYGEATLGLLGFTIRIIAAPVSLLGQAVGRVFQGEASAVVRTGERRLTAIVRSNAKTLLWLGAPICVVLAIGGPFLFGVIFGSEWTQAGEYARWLSVGYLAQLAVSPISQTLLVLERQGQQLAWDISRLVATVGGPTLAAALGASALVAIIVLSAAFLVCYATLYFACLGAARRYDGARPDPSLAG